jgi:hypothetical protein
MKNYSISLVKLEIFAWFQANQVVLVSGIINYVVLCDMAVNICSILACPLVGKVYQFQR